MVANYNDPDYWRDGAETLREMAKRLPEDDAKEIWKLVADYERLAERAEDRLKKTSASSES